MLWLQMYVKLSAIKGAASFNNLGQILSKPKALVRSIFFFRYFSIFFKGYFWYCKKVSVGILSLQNYISL